MWMICWQATLLLAVLLVGYRTLANLPTWRKIGLFFALAALSCTSVVTALGTPKPAALQLRRLEGTMLAYSLDEGRAIDVWVLPDQTAEPVAIRLGWSEPRASNLEQASKQGLEQHRAVRIEVGGLRKSNEGKAGAAVASISGTGIPGNDSLTGDDDAISANLAPISPVKPKS